MKYGNLFLAALTAIALCSCSSPGPVKEAWSFYNSNYDRALSLSTSTDGKPQVSYTIKPKEAAVLSDKQVADLMAHFAEYAKRDGKTVIATEGGK